MFYLDRGGLPSAARPPSEACKNAYKRHGRSSRLRETRANLIYISFYNGEALSVRIQPWPSGCHLGPPGSFLGPFLELLGSRLGPHEML